MLPYSEEHSLRLPTLNHLLHCLGRFGEVLVDTIDGVITLD